MLTALIGDEDVVNYLIDLGGDVNITSKVSSSVQFFLLRQ
jgi:hypothetical protein